VTGDRSDSTKTLSLWKHLVIPSLVGGTGLGLILVCAIGAFCFYRARPKPWNLNAICPVEPRTAAVDLSVGLVPNTIPAKMRQDGAAFTPDSASVKPATPGRAAQDTTSSGTEQSRSAEQGLAGIVAAGLRNTTREDITLPQSVLVMESEEGSHVLHSSKFTLDHDYFIPAGHAVSVTLMADDPCAPENSPEMCVESYFNGVDEIVLFDKPARYEVHIPLKAIRLLRIEPKQQPEKRVIAPTGTAVIRQQPNTREESQRRAGGQAALDPLHPHGE